MENRELKHWGIKGMKWGIRRFQKKDGSLTPEGKKRYDDNDLEDYHKQKVKEERKERTKKLIKVGIAAATTAAVIYGIKKYRDAQNEGIVEKGESVFKKMMDESKKTKATVKDVTNDGADDVFDLNSSIGSTNVLSLPYYPDAKSPFSSTTNTPDGPSSSKPINERVAESLGINANKVRDTILKSEKALNNNTDISKDDDAVLKALTKERIKDKETRGNELSTIEKLAKAHDKSDDSVIRSLRKSSDGDGSTEDEAIRFKLDQEKWNNKKDSDLSPLQKFSKNKGYSEAKTLNKIRKAREDNASDEDDKFLYEWEEEMRKGKKDSDLSPVERVSRTLGISTEKLKRSMRKANSIDDNKSSENDKELTKRVEEEMRKGKKDSDLSPVEKVARSLGLTKQQVANASYRARNDEEPSARDKEILRKIEALMGDQVKHDNMEGVNFKMENRELKHSGIKGMRWGIRRFQNKDGSLTPEGKKRYGDNPYNSPEDEERVRAETKKAVMNSGDIKKVKAYESELTNDELRKALDRVDLNKRLNGLDAQQRESGFNSVMSTLDKVDKVRSGAEKILNTYNLVAKINNTFNKNQMKTIDGQYKEAVDKYTQELIKSGSAKDVVKNFGKLNVKDLEEINKRMNYEDNIRKRAEK